MTLSVATVLTTLSVATVLMTTPVHAGLCETCKDGVNSIIGEVVGKGKAACTKVCPHYLPSALCNLVCPTLDSICHPGSDTDCGATVCAAISVCQSNPWEHEVVWNFTLPTFTPTLQGDTIVLTSSPPSDDVPPGKVRVGIKCDGSTWWKAITMFKNTTYLKEVAHTQDQQGVVNWGLIQYEELANHYFTLSKAETFGIHVNVYHITNAADMQEQGSYLFDWQVDSTKVHTLSEAMDITTSNGDKTISEEPQAGNGSCFGRDHWCTPGKGITGQDKCCEGLDCWPTIVRGGNLGWCGPHASGGRKRVGDKTMIV